MNFTKAQIAKVCREFGPMLQHYIPSDFNGVRLLWALAGNESSFGLDAQKSRFEKAYAPGGIYHKREMLDLYAQYGDEACKSFGFTQLMLVNAPGFTPDELKFQLDKAASATVGYITRRIFPKASPEKWPADIRQFADAYNSGNCHDDKVPLKYMNEFETNYHSEIPIDA